MQRIVILGGPGSGKSTLAQKLGQHYQLPVYHIDTIFWLSGWRINDIDIIDTKIKEILNMEQWITDGNYTKFSFNERLNLSDLIILLDYNRFVGLFSAIKRRFLYRNKSRESMTVGCNEKIDFTFLKYILLEYPEKKEITKIKLNMLKNKNIIIFKNRRELKQWMEKEGIKYEVR